MRQHAASSAIGPRYRPNREQPNMMMTFTQSQLYDAVQQYVQNQDALLSEARAAVVQWKYADSEMLGMFPLFDEIGFRGDNQWRAASRSWFPEKPADPCYEHGIDSAGRVRIIQRGPLTTLVSYADQMIDEMLFRDRQAAPRALKRYVLENGRVTACYEYCISPHQYTCETFRYDDGKLLQSEQKSWYITDGTWVEASWTTTCFYEYDSAGLIRVFRDMGKQLGGKKLVFVRPKAGSLLENKHGRRPFVAYTIVITDDCDDPEHETYSDAYGLEMNIDDEWAVDTVLLAPPGLVRVITQDTGVTSMGTVFAGASSIAAMWDLRKVKRAGGKWVLLDADDPKIKRKVGAVLKAALNVILSVNKPSDISAVLVGTQNLTHDRLVVAVRVDQDCSPDSAQALAAKMRSELESLNCGDSRLIIASRIGNDEVVNYLRKLDIDGVLHYDGGFDSTLDVLIPIALESQ